MLRYTSLLGGGIIFHTSVSALSLLKQSNNSEKLKGDYAKLKFLSVGLSSQHAGYNKIDKQIGTEGLSSIDKQFNCMR